MSSNNTDITAIKSLVKECLGIISSATSKDNEIESLIYSAIAYLTKLGIEVDLTNALQKSCIVMFVKGHFGMINNDEKEKYMNSCNLLASFLQVTSEEE